MSTTTIQEANTAYSPGALLNAFGSSLTSPLLYKVFIARGLYRAGKGVNYNGAFYDLLKDEFSESNMVLVVPERLRAQLRDGQLIEASVYLSKRFQANSGRVDLLLTLNELLAKKEKAIDEQATRIIELLQKKAKTGYKDIDSFVRNRLFQQQPIGVTILVGQGAIIDQDIKHQVREALIAYQFRYIRVNLSQSNEIIQALHANQDSDILVIARGGGENMAIFDNLAIAEAALNLRCFFVTALGHTVDEPLLQKIADKSLITPTALGQYFHDLYNKTLDDLNSSKTQLIADLTKQIEVSYQHKLVDLEKRLVDLTSFGRESSQKADLRERDLEKRLVEVTRFGEEANQKSGLREQDLSQQLRKTKAILTAMLIVCGLVALYFILRK